MSAEWAKTSKAASIRPWTNAAKVIASIAAERPDARYVEGWRSRAACRTRCGTRGWTFHSVLAVRQRELVAMAHVGGRSELDRLAAMGVLPRPK